MKTVLGTLVAVIRFSIIILALFIMMIVITIASFTPIKIRRIPLAGWLTHYLVLFITRMLNVRVHMPDRTIFYEHSGFIFPNHSTFIDILVSFSIMPTRFLAFHGVETMPFIGRIAKAIGCAFVNRGDKNSRRAAREAMKRVPKYPPMILYPEGGINPPPTEISPLRYGAFEIAKDANYSYMPIVLIYDKLDLIFSEEDNTILVAWEFCKHLTRVNVSVHPLPVVHPQPDDDPHQLAREAEAAMAEVLKREQAKLGLRYKGVAVQ